MTTRTLWHTFLIIGLLATPALGQDQTNSAATNAPPSAVASLIDELKAQAEKGDPDAEEKLGNAYHEGRIVPKDDAQAFAWCLKAAQQGNTLAGYNVAYMYNNGVGTAKDLAAGFQWYLTLAQKGDARAQFLTGLAFSSGQGTPKDPAQAFAWFQKAALQGDAPAQNALGQAYRIGFGVTRDDKLSFEWYTKAANQGFAQAQLMVAKAYTYGIGTPRDLAQGVAWYEKASVQGNAEAGTQLGIACIKGTGTPVDLKKGFTCLLCSAKSDATACSWIAWCYSNGTFVTRDPVQAYAWALRSSSMASSDYVTKFLAGLKPTLTTDQIAEAQKLVPDLNLLLDGVSQPTDVSTTFADGKSTLISYHDTYGEILIPIDTPDHALAYLMFDTGASGSILDQEYATKTGLKSNAYVTLAGIGQSINLAKLSDKTNLALQGLTFNNFRCAIGQNLVFDTDSGQPIVGILGLDLVKNLVVRINYNDHTIEFIQPDSFSPQPSDGNAYPLIFGKQGPFINCTMIQEGAQVSGLFLIDTGNSGSIDVTKKFQDTSPALKLHRIASSAASGIGGVAYSTIGTCSTFVLGDIALPNPRVEFEQDNQGVMTQVESGTIGSLIWRRFNVCLDFPRKKVYLQKNSHFDEPYSYATAGMHIIALAPDYTTLTIREILPDSAAARAGFQTGDILTEITELGKEPLLLQNVYPLIHTPGTYHCVVRRQDKSVSLVLQIEDPVNPAPATPTQATK